MTQPKFTEIPHGKFLIICDDLLTPDECRDLIAQADDVRTDSMGNKAWHAADTGGKYQRVVMVNEQLAERLWQRLQFVIPKTYGNYRLLYLNPYFRFSKYDVGGSFPIHRDGVNVDTLLAPRYGCSNTRSMLTLNIFLNGPEDLYMDDAGGGTTFFHNNKHSVRYVARQKQGRAALFDADQYHRGDVVLRPYKYLLRTDVMAVPKTNSLTQ